MSTSDTLTAPSTVVLSRGLLRAGDVSELLGLPVSTVYELVRRRELPALRIGRAVRFSREDLERYLARHCRTGDPE